MSITAQVLDNQTSPWARVALTIGSILAAVGAVGYVSLVLVDSDLSNREAFEAPLTVVSCLSMTAGLLLAMVALGHGRVAGVGWPILIGTMALFFAAANAWFLGTGVLSFTDVMTDEQFDEVVDSPGILFMLAPKMVLGLIGFVTHGISGWRSRSLSRVTALFYGLAGLAFLVPPFPPGVLIVSVALFLQARSAAAR